MSDPRTFQELVTALRSTNPDLGAPTLEPSLDSFVYRYYRAHFDHDEARAFTNVYFEGLVTSFLSTLESKKK